MILHFINPNYYVLYCILTSISYSGGPETMTENDVGMEKIKYISCGHCKLWFFAPKESIYVLCPQCEVINNCGKPKRVSIILL